MTRHVYVLAAGVVTAILTVAPAVAQTRFHPYAGASVGSFSVSADEVDGRSVSGGLFGGVSLAKYVDLDVEFVLPADTFTRSYTGPSVSFAGPGSSYDEIVRRSRHHPLRQVAGRQRDSLSCRRRSSGARQAPHARPDPRRDQPSCPRSNGLHAGVDPRGHRPAASISRRPASKRIRGTLAVRQSARTSPSL